MSVSNMLVTAATSKKSWLQLIAHKYTKLIKDELSR